MRVLLKCILAIVLVGIYLALSLPSTSPTIYSIEDTVKTVKLPPLENRILDQMDMRQKVGQLFLFGFSTTTVDETLTTFIQSNGIGGVLLLGRNIQSQAQVKELISNMQSLSYFPLLISIDQEGGVVSRLKWNNILTKAQKNMTDEAEAYSIAYQRGNMLKDVGINVNLAPVVEYITSPSSFLYQRVFRGTKEHVAYMSKASIQGYIFSNTISVPKHYPGHSNTSLDSHYALPKVYISNNDWAEYIYTFRYLIEENIVDMIMVGHILYPNIDTVPSTVSPVIIHDKLRDTLGYNGVILTDDMLMDAIEGVGEYEDIAKRALLAGNDILLYRGNTDIQKRVYDYILNSVTEGDIPESIIDEKVLRILRLKIKYNLIDKTILQP